jgi:membrane protease YdiL (CAAX protease family)
MGLALVLALVSLLGVGSLVWAALRIAARHSPLSGEMTNMLGYGCAAAATALAYVVMVRRADRRSLLSAGLTAQGLFSETGIGLLIGGGVFSAVMGMMRAVGVYHIAGINPHFRPLVPLLLFLFLAVFQEIAVRGYIFQTLERRWGTGVALAGSTLFFGLAHLGSSVAGLTTAQRLVGPAFISIETGLLFTAAYLLTRRLWLPIGIHWGWNFFESSVYGAANTGSWGNERNTLFSDRFAGPFLLTGGPFGPEASVICLVIGAYAGLLLLRLAIRKGQWRDGNQAATLRNNDDSPAIR